MDHRAGKLQRAGAWRLAWLPPAVATLRLVAIGVVSFEVAESRKELSARCAASCSRLALALGGEMRVALGSRRVCCPVRRVRELAARAGWTSASSCRDPSQLAEPLVCYMSGATCDCGHASGHWSGGQDKRGAAPARRSGEARRCQRPHPLRTGVGAAEADARGDDRGRLGVRADTSERLRPIGLRHTKDDRRWWSRLLAVVRDELAIRTKGSFRAVVGAQ